MLKNPCWNCEKRNPWCHAYCLKYKEFERENEDIRRMKAKEREFFGARTEGIKHRDKKSFRKNYSKL